MATTTGELVSEETYRELAVLGEYQRAELYRGQLREKPLMSVEHGEIESRLAEQLIPQLDRDEYRVRIEHARLRVSPETYYIPDLVVIPTLTMQTLRERPMTLDAYLEPLPLVVEVWSPRTGDYDVAVKLRDYQHRGDHEIWLVHPYERTLTAWRRQPDGGYVATVYREGHVQPALLPGVTIDLDELFAS
ncbi:MAG: Uma2 family endonuclease [Thermomicrobiales bacterium]